MYKHTVLLLLSLLCATGFAQRSQYGREFYTIFAPNQGAVNQQTNFGIYIHSVRETNARVEIPAIGFFDTVRVIPGIVTKVAIPHANPSAELRVYEQVVSGMSAHVTADEDISVTCLNAKEYSADASVVYPKEALGQRYVILSFANSKAAPAVETSSLFAIVAVHNNTTLTIVPACKTKGGKLPGTPFTVTLNDGDVYLVSTDSMEEGADLTGSVVTADEPIAVFGCHARTEIPFEYKQPGGVTTSRDHLFEQLLPTESYGDTLIIAPLEQSEGAQLVRIIATEPNTVINVNDQTSTLDSVGSYHQLFPVTTPLTVTSNLPIVAGQYLHSAPTVQSTGDPSLSLVTSTDLYSLNHTFVTFPDPIFTSHAAQIIMTNPPTSLKIDGTHIPSAQFTSIPNSAFSYTNIVLPPGLHFATADVPMNVTVYGTGQVISYAYNAGLGNAIPLSVDQVPSSHRFFITRASDDQFALSYILTTPSRLSISIYDLLGRMVYESNDQYIDGNGSFPVTIPETRGTYFVRIQTFDLTSQSTEEQVLTITR